MSEFSLDNLIPLPKEEFINPDDLFDPIWGEKTQLENPTVMSEWARNYKKRIESLAPSFETPKYEEDVALSEIIQRGKKASHYLDTRGNRLSEAQLEQLEETARLGEQARIKLVESHLRLALWFVRQTMDLNKRHRLKNNIKGHRGNIVKFWEDLSGGQLDYDERVQIVSVGLLKAADTYTGTTSNGKRVTFGNWALYRMEGHLVRALHQTAQSPFKIPQETYEKVSKIKSAIRSLEDEGNFEPTVDEIARVSNMYPREANRLIGLAISSQNISLEALKEYLFAKENSKEDQYPFDESLTIEDIVVSNGEDDTVEVAATQSIPNRALINLIEKTRLRERDKLVIDLRFWNTHTLDEIGGILGLTRERVRQIESKTLSALRSGSSAYKYLRDGEPTYSYDDPQFGIRSEIKLDSNDSFALGIECPVIERSDTTVPIDRYVNARLHTVEEIEDAMRSVARWLSAFGRPIPIEILHVLNKKPEDKPKYQEDLYIDIDE